MFLLDTCVISELVKTSPHPEVVGWLEQQKEEDLFLSALTIGELRKGISKLPQSARKEKLTEWVTMDLVRRFSGKILEIDIDVARRWGEMQGEAERRGKGLPVMDSLIAATAAVHNLEVITRNTRDMERCGVAVFNPWSAEG